MPKLQALLHAAAVTAVHRKVTLAAGPNLLTLAITSPQVQHSSLESDWKQVPRPGGKPFLGKVGPKLKQIRFDAILQPSGGRTVSRQIEWLKHMGESDLVVYISYGQPEAGPWHCTGLEIATVTRQFITNEPTRATASFTFTEATPPPAPSATRSAAPTFPGGPVKTAAPRTRTYVVHAGDTLSKIALRFYYDASAWTYIAAANHLRNTLIRPGQRLIIP